MTREQIYREIERKYGTVDLRKPGRIWNRYEDLENYFGEYLSEEIVKSFLNDYRKDYILENLQTHDYGKLVTKIKQMFPKISFQEDKLDTTRTYFNLYIKGTKEMSALKATQVLENSIKEIQNVSAFFGYEPTVKVGIISFEPKYTENVDDFIYNNCYGIVYHITSRKNAERIQKSGLRIRTGDLELTTRANPPRQNYRNFPKRIYVSAFDPERTENIRSELKDIADVVGESDDMVAIRIRIPNKKISFYKDTAMRGLGEGNSFYTYTNIPKEYVDYLIDL